jgi:hypothetical protein
VTGTPETLTALIALVCNCTSNDLGQERLDLRGYNPGRHVDLSQELHLFAGTSYRLTDYARLMKYSSIHSSSRAPPGHFLPAGSTLAVYDPALGVVGAT